MRDLMRKCGELGTNRQDDSDDPVKNYLGMVAWKLWKIYSLKYRMLYVGS